MNQSRKRKPIPSPAAEPGEAIPDWRASPSVPWAFTPLRSWRKMDGGIQGRPSLAPRKVREVSSTLGECEISSPERKSPPLKRIWAA